MQAKLRIVVVIGTRPDAVKLLPLVAHLRARYGSLETAVVSTGQRCEMLDQVLDVTRGDEDLAHAGGDSIGTLRRGPAAAA